MLCFETFKKQQFMVSDLHGLEHQILGSHWPKRCLKFRRNPTLLQPERDPVRQAPRSLQHALGFTSPPLCGNMFVFSGVESKYTKRGYF